jgi:hypothetical protein
MGVRKHRTFISFLSEPYSCFEVNSSLGKKETKMHNLKRLDSAVVQRIKAVSHSTDQSAEFVSDDLRSLCFVSRVNEHEA